MILFVAAIGLFIGFLAIAAYLADAMGEPERWDSRRRNR